MLHVLRCSSLSISREAHGRHLSLVEMQLRNRHVNQILTRAPHAHIRPPRALGVSLPRRTQPPSHVVCHTSDILIMARKEPLHVERDVLHHAQCRRGVDILVCVDPVERLEQGAVVAVGPLQLEKGVWRFGALWVGLPLGRRVQQRDSAAQLNTQREGAYVWMRVWMGVLPAHECCRRPSLRQPGPGLHQGLRGVDTSAV